MVGCQTPDYLYIVPAGITLATATPQKTHTLHAQNLYDQAPQYTPETAGSEDC